MEPPRNNSGRFFLSLAARNIVEINQDEMNALEEAGFEVPNPLATMHTKVFISGVIYEPGVMARDVNRKFDDSIVYVRNFNDPDDQGRFLEIVSIWTWQDVNAEDVNGIVGRLFDIQGPAFGSDNMKIVVESDNLLYVPVDHVVAPAVKVQTEIGMYMSPLPTNWDID